MNRKTVLNKGDIVTIHPGSTGGRNGGPFDLEVKRVKERHVFDHHRGDFLNHVVIGHRVDDGKEETFNFDFIREIKSRAPSPASTLPENIFRGFNIVRSYPRRSGKMVTETLFNLIVYALGKLPYRLTRKINEERAFALFHKQRPGLISVEWVVFTVNERVFCRWVRKNYHKLLQTTKELIAKETAQYERDQDQIETDMAFSIEMDMSVLENRE